MSVADIEAKRAARKAALEEQRKAQYEKDLEALDKLECEHGDGAVAAVEAPRFVPGMPTLAIVRAPKGAEFKRYRDRIAGTANGKNAGATIVSAQDELASVCRVYPDSKAYESMCESFAGLHVSMAVAAAKLADAKVEEAGKD